MKIAMRAKNGEKKKKNSSLIAKVLEGMKNEKNSDECELHSLTNQAIKFCVCTMKNSLSNFNAFLIPEEPAIKNSQVN